MANALGNIRGVPFRQHCLFVRGNMKNVFHVVQGREGVKEMPKQGAMNKKIGGDKKEK